MGLWKTKYVPSDLSWGEFPARVLKEPPGFFFLLIFKCKRKSKIKEVLFEKKKKERLWRTDRFKEVLSFFSQLLYVRIKLKTGFEAASVLLQQSILCYNNR